MQVVYLSSGPFEPSTNFIGQYLKLPVYSNEYVLKITDV